MSGCKWCTNGCRRFRLRSDTRTTLQNVGVLFVYCEDSNRFGDTFHGASDGDEHTVDRILNGGDEDVLESLQVLGL